MRCIYTYTVYGGYLVEGNQKPKFEENKASQRQGRNVAVVLQKPSPIDCQLKIGVNHKVRDNNMWKQAFSIFFKHGRQR